MRRNCGTTPRIASLVLVTSHVNRRALSNAARSETTEWGLFGIDRKVSICRCFCGIQVSTPVSSENNTVTVTMADSSRSSEEEVWDDEKDTLLFEGKAIGHRSRVSTRTNILLVIVLLASNLISVLTTYSFTDRHARSKYSQDLEGSKFQQSWSSFCQQILTLIYSQLRRPTLISTVRCLEWTSAITDQM